VIGKTGMIVIVRLSSFLLVCIGVQIMWNGISALGLLSTDLEAAAFGLSTRMCGCGGAWDSALEIPVLITTRF
jgi:MarC family integral membrane protein